MDAAKQAKDRGVRVYTIGFGTEDGSSFPNCSPQYQGTEPFGSGGPPQFGGGGGGGLSGGFRRGIDETTLRQVSEATGGKYYAAASASELEQVFAQLPTYVILKHQTSEISAMFAVAGAVLALIAIGLSLLWHPLP
jgi:Ca-activated chloride channel family protein